MQCELCGNKVQGPPKTVRVEHATLQVCAGCARFGVEVPPLKRTEPGKKPLSTGKPANPRRSRDVFDFIEGDIVEDYSERIRSAREAKGWSHKELALQIMERELLIRKLEKGELIPEDELRKKLEKALGIRLIDTVESVDQGKNQGHLTPTLGDLISIRRPQK
ncbi:MAG: multiprotein bridging factor aMBF1 [Methanomicrobiales archaeon]|jgi:putative transcription factor|nr:multiprotein bridging factor aMBF1 [Methanomicrobiales archaeon]